MTEGMSDSQPRKRARTGPDQEATSRFWFPWHDRIVSVHVQMPPLDWLLNFYLPPDMHFRHTHALAPFRIFPSPTGLVPLAFEGESG
jgi:hypothetical protein